jgi:hypothetical protein
MSEGPKSFAITSDGRVVVSDVANNRVNIYNMIFDFIQSIPSNNDLSWSLIAPDVKPDEHGGLIYLDHHYGVLKINKEFKKEYEINIKDLPVKNIIKADFYPINTYLFFYDKDGYVRCIDEIGVLKNNAESLAIMDTLNKRASSNKVDNLDSIKKEIGKDKKRIIISDIYYFQRPELLDQYKKSLGQKSVAQNNNKSVIDYAHTVFESLISYDKDNNSYWTFRNFGKEWQMAGIIILSKNGDLLEKFYYKDVKISDTSLPGFIALDTTGNIYFMQGDGKLYYFYKIARKW